MVVSQECTSILVLISSIPKLDGRVARARCKQCTATRSAVVKVKDRFGVSLDGKLQLAQLPIPYFDRAVFCSGGQ